MGERTEYTPGTFCWTDLTTTDQEAAKAFYAGLFGWDIQDTPVGDRIVYSRAFIDGKDVAAISPQPEMQRNAGAPPSWNSYVSVEDADATADKAKELGANVHAPAFDVLDVGRMAVIQDPQGAFFFVWQPKLHFGAHLVNAPGALCWNELQTNDLDAAKEFYSGLFGWKVEPFEGTGEPYLVISNGDKGNGGVRPVPPGMHPNWLVYFATEDVETSMAKVEELGGTVHAGPIDIQIAKIAVVADPQGAIFALYAGELQP
jgi:predicted enzyme related to lactoylglutathione lyase